MSMAKRLAVVPSGSGQVKMALIEPGVTAADLKKELNLEDYLLTKPDSTQPFADNTSLYEAVKDGEKLVATRKAEVGAGWLPLPLIALCTLGVWAWQKWSKRPGTPSSARPANPSASGPRAARGNVMSLGVRQQGEAGSRTEDGFVRVMPDMRPIWEQRGWRTKDDRYTGRYRTRSGSWPGEVRREAPGLLGFYISKPPEKVLSGSHGACFRDKGKGRYAIHIRPTPQDVDSGIVAVERVLEESLA